MDRYFKIKSNNDSNNEEIIINAYNLVDAVNEVNMNGNHITKVVECDERGQELISVPQANELLPLVIKMLPLTGERLEILEKTYKRLLSKEPTKL